MLQPITYDPKRLLAYLRADNEETILVALNFGRRKVRLAMGRDLANRQWELLLSSKSRENIEISQGWLSLAGEEACILRTRS